MITRGLTGKGFAGVIAYITHDVNSHETDLRVSAVYTRNLGRANPERAASIMKSTARLNKRCKKPVYHLVVSWHQDDADKLTGENQKEQIEKIITGLGLEDHEAVIAYHTDKDHPHAHIVINRVHPETHRTAQLSFDGVRRGQIARKLEREYGLTIAPLDIRDKDKNLPALILKDLTRMQATFTAAQLEYAVSKMTDSEEETLKFTSEILERKDVFPVAVDAYNKVRYSTADYAAAEHAMFAYAQDLSEQRNYAIPAPGFANDSFLSEEQKQAVHDITTGQNLSILIGRAGAGKTTAMKEVVHAYQSQGFKVMGASPTGAAAKTLGSEADIEAKTIHSWNRQWQNGKGLGDKTVLLVDEAGMLSTRWMKRVLEAALEHKAKVILLGDSDQLKAVEAGDAFRGLVERHGYSEIKTIRRQQIEWQRQASQDFAAGDVSQGFSAYEVGEAVSWSDEKQESQERLIQDYIKDLEERPEGSRLMLCYERAQVKELNQILRQSLKEKGLLDEGQSYYTAEGKKDFALNDRVVFTKNDYGEDLGVRNGTFGTVQAVDGKGLSVKLDSGDMVRFSMDRYDHITHGYAVTVHKSQGATVDKSYVMLSQRLDKNAAYVAFSRHRYDCQIYADKATFDDKEAVLKTLERPAFKDLLTDHSGIERDTVQEQSELEQENYKRALITPEMMEEIEAQTEALSKEINSVMVQADNFERAKLMGKQHYATLKVPGQKLEALKAEFKKSFYAKEIEQTPSEIRDPEKRKELLESYEFKIEEREKGLYSDREKQRERAYWQADRKLKIARHFKDKQKIAEAFAERQLYEKQIEEQNIELHRRQKESLDLDL